ncbi:uncharacterized protein A4U43_C10F10880 [Asparagus officinalis]|uniref:Uncharacterized protein n=1 Tax=Asparagus officinalis TaxID=4686 RepID=A0A5P1E578_ASPOF|nr:uncharacterized protein A4U43_C10F10880 [Asparagus officinalis]
MEVTVMVEETGRVQPDSTRSSRAVLRDHRRRLAGAAMCSGVGWPSRRFAMQSSRRLLKAWRRFSGDEGGKACGERSGATRVLRAYAKRRAGGERSAMSG